MWLSGQWELYETVLRTYFYQVTLLQDVQDAWEGKDSEFRVDRSKPLPQLEFIELRDVISELGLTTIFTEGKFSNKVTTFKPELVNLRSTYGLGHLYVENDRIVTHKRDTFVEGLMGKSHLVSP